MRRFGLNLSAVAVCILSAVAICMSSCEDNTWRSSVPAYPVRLTIDTKLGEFVHFQPTATGTYVVANRDGYFLNDKYVLPFPVTDAYGYGGVVVYVDLFGYSAYDLACPHCASKGACVPCIVDGVFATCPQCTEQYDLMSGTAAPQKGLIKEPLRQLNVINSDGKLTITQK